MVINRWPFHQYFPRRGTQLWCTESDTGLYQFEEVGLCTLGKARMAVPRWTYQLHLRLGGSPGTHCPPLSSAFLHLCICFGSWVLPFLCWLQSMRLLSVSSWRLDRKPGLPGWGSFPGESRQPYLELLLTWIPSHPSWERLWESPMCVSYQRSLHTLTFFFSLCPHMGLSYLLNIKNILCKNQETNIKPKLKFKSSKVSSLLKIRNTAVMVIFSLYLFFYLKQFKKFLNYSCHSVLY